MLSMRRWVSSPYSLKRIERLLVVLHNDIASSVLLLNVSDISDQIAALVDKTSFAFS
jgi:putative ribosome biogenesis GTPase RsgA